MEVDHVPYIFGSFSRRRHSQEVSKSKRNSINASANHAHSLSQPHVMAKKKDIMDGPQETKTTSKPIFDIFHHSKKEDTKEVITEEDFRTKNIVRLALDDISPIFGTPTSFPKSIRKETGSVKSRSSFHPTFEESVHYFPSEKEEDANPVVTKEEDMFMCYWCKKIYTEPRVLPCLHYFCTDCLFDIQTNEGIRGTKGSNGSRNGSVCSGYNSGEYREELRSARKKIRCPKCGDVSNLPGDGVQALPPNYILQHRLVLAKLNKESTKLLCDICSEDIIASHRCSQCLVNLCPHCTDAHVRQVATSVHELLDLRDKGITKLSRQIMCPTHPEQELVFYCTTCSQVACRECTRTRHSHHVGETLSEAGTSRAAGLKDAIERTRTFADRAASVCARIEGSRSQWVNQCTVVGGQIEKFIEVYRREVEEHREALLQQVSQVKEDQLKILTTQQQDLEQRMQEATNTIQFADDLLKEGSDVEVLTFVETILKKLQNITKTEGEELLATKITESVQFLANEIKENDGGKFPMSGVISTQKVSTVNCIIKKEGAGMDNLRVYRRVDIILETRDSSDNALSHGGLNVAAELWYRDAGMTCRSLNVQVTDRKDGTYLITFVPDTPGKLSLGVTVKGQHIKDSPFPVTVRTARPHGGTYHCCSFCSSGGGRGPAGLGCACGGTMPGGYGGCGHGHEGHPGRRHWSCCGSVLENSECRRQSRATYQFTL